MRLHSSAKENGKVYIGESNSDYPATRFSRSETELSESSLPSPLYETARIFGKESWYEFNIDNTGVTGTTYMVRLHFFAFSSPTNLSSASFNVSVPGFWLLQNFHPINNTDDNSASVNEFFLKITHPNFRITFTPLPSSFAFVNAIELFLLPLYFIADGVSRFTYRAGRGTSPYKGLLSRALETKHRINVGGQNVTRDKDSLLRNWIPDDIYLSNPGNVKNSVYNGQINYYVSDDWDGPNSNRYIAPNDVYGTAKEISNISDVGGDSNLLNIAWGLPVDKNTDHLVRLHFCDFWNMQRELTIFDLYIYNNFVMPVNNDTVVVNQLPAPYYYDFVVHSDNSGLMNISVAPIVSDSIPNPNAFLNGLEIMKLIDSSGPVPADKDESKNRRLPVLLGSVLGPVVLIFVLVVVGILWHLKIRKHPILWSSGSRLTEGTIQSSHHPNVDLRLKLPLLDLQLATNNFDANMIIGKGGFGNVYKGVFKNAMTVAVKRSETGSGNSGQGLPEFQNEILILSKIRHKHLVSLIGYCDERHEMILVYEYMEKGSLRDHLYNTNLPSLSWKQRLEICIGAARGLHYLHKGVTGGIIHRDVKTTNILLDENYVAKVADFGLSTTGPVNLESYVSTDVKGTFGYLDPEYFKLLKLTEKSDVYSFGVVLLEVLCARPVIDPSLPREMVNLPEWGMFCKSKGMLEDIIDPSIKGKIDHNSLRKFSETVEKCLQDYGCERPPMVDVLWGLEYALQLQIQQGSIHTGPQEVGSSTASSSLQLPNVSHLPSFSTLSEVDGLSIVKGSELDSAAESIS
ncbi:hypothetical protein RJT34_30790 [Clitoria ternatea]|uniref:Protein kinase domain-containing protein n=1 Tax=Clitoria ternatea TaxID=43366 RepID=A0AAN9EU24_CLITE